MRHLIFSESLIVVPLLPYPLDHSKQTSSRRGLPLPSFTHKNPETNVLVSEVTGFRGFDLEDTFSCSTLKSRKRKRVWI